jgi:putative molybdopterin biosynthesis protein
MQIIQHIHSGTGIKLLGDPTRLGILRNLIARQATISQLGEIFHIHPAQVRNHIKALEKAGYVELVSVQMGKNFVEKYYRATARMFVVNEVILSEPPAKDQLVVLSSDDPALNFLISRVNDMMNKNYIYTIPVGSLDALIFLRDKFSDIAGCHLYDIASQTYNTPYIQHLFSDEEMVLVNFVSREQGLYVEKGNPLNITGLMDLTRNDVTFKNRNKGAGTRVWFDQQIKSLNLHYEDVNFSQGDALTHAEVAKSVAAGLASTGLGVYSVSRAYGLDFVPLFSEQYDLVMRKETFESPGFQPVMDMLNNQANREFILHMGGYSVLSMGTSHSI